MINSLDKRTENYLKKIKDKFHFVGCNGGESLGIKDILAHKGMLDAAELTEIWRDEGLNYTTILYKYKLESAIRYCAEIWVPYGGDGLYTHTFIFNQEPNEEAVKIIRLVHELQVKIEIGDLKPEFTCWECGMEVHWLDGNPEIEQFEQAYENLKNKYCGC